MNKDEFQNTSSGKGRKLFLVLVLLVVLGVFGYDYFVAKPAYQEGIKQLQAMLDPKKNETGEAVIEQGNIIRIGDLDKDGFVTQEDVRKAMGRDPKNTETREETTIIETYAWPRGIPLMTYDAYVVYYKSADRTTLLKVTESKPEIKKPVTMSDRPADLTRAGNPAADRAAKEKEAAEKGKGEEGTEDKAAADKAAADKAAEDKAAEDKAADKAAADKAAADKAAADKAAADKAAADKAAADKAAADKAAEDKAAEDKKEESPAEGGGEESGGEGN